jgi:hypothetical protein
MAAAPSASKLVLERLAPDQAPTVEAHPLSAISMPSLSKSTKGPCCLGRIPIHLASSDDIGSCKSPDSNSKSGQRGPGPETEKRRA